MVQAMPDEGSGEAEEGSMLEQAEAKRVEGNELFKAGDTMEAGLMYLDSIMLCKSVEPANDEELARINKCELGCKLNMSLVTLQHADWEAAVEWCSQALLHGPHPKALFRRAQVGCIVPQSLLHAEFRFVFVSGTCAVGRQE